MDCPAEIAQSSEYNLIEIIVLACKIAIFSSAWGKLDSVRVVAVVVGMRSYCTAQLCGCVGVWGCVWVVRHLNPENTTS